MSEFFEYDPQYGIKTETAFDEMTQEMTLIRTADVEPVLDYTKAMANDGDVSKRGIKDSWWLYAKLPPIVILQLRAKGINVYDRNDQQRMFAEINTNYPHLKCTTGNYGKKVGFSV
jgi:hypothetical protein